LFDGDTIEPSVSLPIATAARLAATAAPEPELEPDGFRSSAYGLRHWPPRPLQPLEECVERKFAHSERLVLPSSTAPASRSFFTRNASAAGVAPTSAREPALVFMRSAVPTLSFRTIGIPWSGPRTLPALRSASSRSAIDGASGSSSSTARSSGPRRSSASMRAEYFATSVRAESAPDAMRFCRSAIVASSRSKAGTEDPGGAGAADSRAPSGRAAAAALPRAP
jgi:hypothetical protein